MYVASANPVIVKPRYQFLQIRQLRDDPRVRSDHYNLTVIVNGYASSVRVAEKYKTEV